MFLLATCMAHLVLVCFSNNSTFILFLCLYCFGLTPTISLFWPWSLVVLRLLNVVGCIWSMSLVCPWFSSHSQLCIIWLLFVVLPGCHLFLPLLSTKDFHFRSKSGSVLTVEFLVRSFSRKSWHFVLVALGLIGF